MIPKPSPHSLALLQAFLVTFLWSTSWVLIMIGLQDLPALLFSGLRYALAFQPALRPFYSRLKIRHWLLLLVYGLVLYSLAQGALFLGLAGLPAATVGLMLNFTSLLVAFLGLIFLKKGFAGWACCWCCWVSPCCSCPTDQIMLAEGSNERFFLLEALSIFQGNAL